MAWSLMKRSVVCVCVCVGGGGGGLSMCQLIHYPEVMNRRNLCNLKLV